MICTMLSLSVLSSYLKESERSLSGAHLLLATLAPQEAELDIKYAQNSTDLNEPSTKEHIYHTSYCDGWISNQ